MRIIALLLFALAACTSSQKGGGESASEGEAASPSAEEPSPPLADEAKVPEADEEEMEPTKPSRDTDESGAGEAGTGDDKAGDACIKECVAANQMRAVAPEAIEDDCAKECAGK